VGEMEKRMSNEQADGAGAQAAIQSRIKRRQRFVWAVPTTARRGPKSSAIAEEAARKKGISRKQNDEDNHQTASKT